MESGRISVPVISVLCIALTLAPAAGAVTFAADFTTQDSFTHGFAPFTVPFEDRSTMASSWIWTFGDGQTSIEQNPTHIYTNPGTYTVSLTIRDTTGTETSTKTMTNYIVVAEDPLHAASLPAVPVTTTGTPVPAATTLPLITATSTPIPPTSTTPAMAGYLAVNSDPEGAMVSLDGTELGITPITIYTVPVGQHRVTVHEKGYADNTTPVTIEHQKLTSLTISLEKTGTPTITHPPPGLTPTLGMPAPRGAGTDAASVQKAASEGLENGRFHIYCSGCLERMYQGKQIASIKYDVYSTNPNTGASGLRFFGRMYEDEKIIGNVPVGNYNVEVRPEHFKPQTRPANVTKNKETPVRFNGATFAEAPGFEAMPGTLALAGIIMLRPSGR